MKKVLCAIALASLMPVGAHAANFAECILEKMPGVKNPAAHAAVIRTCTEQSPARWSDIQRGSGRSWLAFKDQDACIIQKTAATALSSAVIAISSACRCLYSVPVVNGEPCEAPWNNGAIAPLGNPFDQFDKK